MKFEICVGALPRRNIQTRSSWAVLGNDFFRQTSRVLLPGWALLADWRSAALMLPGLNLAGHIYIYILLYIDR